LKKVRAILAPLCALLGAVGVALLIFPYEFSVLGPALITVGFLGLILVSGWDEGPRIVVSTFVCALGFVLVVAGLSALAQRTFTADSYRYRFGDRVTAQGVCPVEEIPDRIVLRRRGAGKQATESCPASWSVDGRRIQGRVKFASVQRPVSNQEWQFSMVAYAMGTKASGDSLDIDRHYGVLRYAAIPLWVSGAGLAVFVAGVLIGALLRPRRRPLTVVPR
jgi:hypothetical protein